MITIIYQTSQAHIFTMEVKWHILHKKKKKIIKTLKESGKFDETMLNAMFKAGNIS